ncbi:conserved hypothetical protein [Gluconacetobacter diazotrophicus PA1 5]|uniref:DUF2252 domain-containing protein n=1 Tax=Gluconacetobacter diazotrophicus TaxID=33996 RepID=A0A7W4I5V2_GLUDI|nr:DUF2252 domain-containing protein [Gluconacetobacter diazotrophicus]ACI52264.1 conserved hypothetical protein [Gluconacetobacter diazotrophicus PA1 5]MBB2156816.1 DUF2252 domain-containing protein [Gluconacetobacter diazotrophicus]TWB04841.1 uncharacterized protein (DUF2252 family) [Gluconacetobacter diazotrophicus]
MNAYPADFPTVHPAGILDTREARRARGLALRKTLPRGGHADWSPPAGRADPVAVLERQGASRIASLLPVRYARMAASPFAFLRGAAVVMAADLAQTAWAGPRVQSCGDCHLANFGSYASPEGVPVFDINDFDETLPAPFEWDIKRLGASLVLAGHETGLSDDAARGLAVAAAQAYAGEMARLAPLTPLEIWTHRIDLGAAIDGFASKRVRQRVQALLAARLDAARRHFGLVADDSGAPTLQEKPPLVMRLPENDDAVRSAFARYVATQPPERGILLTRYRLRDVIFKVVGVGSVGTFCAIGLFATADGDSLLLQIKEAQDSVLAPFAGASAFRNQGQRVVTGQRIMQAAPDAFLGWTHTAGQDEAEDTAHALSGAGRQFYVRRVKDTRLAAIGTEIAQEGLPDYALLCGRTLARAHARTGDVVALAAYLGRGRSFADAIGGFSVLYAEQTRRDWTLFKAAIAAGRLPCWSGTAPGGNGGGGRGAGGAGTGSGA